MTEDTKELVKRLRVAEVGESFQTEDGSPELLPTELGLDAADAIKALAGEVATLNVMVTDWIEAFDKQKGRAEAAEAERDRLKAALEAIVKAQYSGGAKTAIARKALGDAT